MKTMFFWGGFPETHEIKRSTILKNADVCVQGLCGFACYERARSLEKTRTELFFLIQT